MLSTQYCPSRPLASAVTFKLYKLENPEYAKLVDFLVDFCYLGDKAIDLLRRRHEVRKEFFSDTYIVVHSRRVAGARSLAPVVL